MKFEIVLTITLQIKYPITSEAQGVRPAYGKRGTLLREREDRGWRVYRVQGQEASHLHRVSEQ